MKKILLVAVMFVWVSMQFKTLNQLVSFVNQLPREQQLTCKVVSNSPIQLFSDWYLVYEK